MFPDSGVKRKIYGYFQEKSIPAILSIRYKNHFAPFKGTLEAETRDTHDKHCPLKPEELFYCGFSLCFFILCHRFFLLSDGLVLENSILLILCDSWTNLQVCLASVKMNSSKGRSHEQYSVSPQLSTKEATATMPCLRRIILNHLKLRCFSQLACLFEVMLSLLY